MPLVNPGPRKLEMLLRFALSKLALKMIPAPVDSRDLHQPLGDLQTEILTLDDTRPRHQK